MNVKKDTHIELADLQKKTSPRNPWGINNFIQGFLGVLLWKTGNVYRHIFW